LLFGGYEYGYIALSLRSSEPGNAALKIRERL